jgi:pseudaminic acid biosynthesis-associated methylase
MKAYKTEQEEFWAGEFGSRYISRNQSNNLLGSNINFFSRSLKYGFGIKNVIEFGANIGMNLKALSSLYPEAELFGVEINKDAVEHLRIEIPKENIFHQSILDFYSPQTWDLVLIKGVLIHMNPDLLGEVYKKLFNATEKYLLIAEYYSPVPVKINYRGNEDKLFKRDFAGEIMDLYPSLSLIDYGFSYKRDPKFPQDDINWFLLKKCDSC